MSNNEHIISIKQLLMCMEGPTVSPYISILKATNKNNKIIIKEFKSNSDNKGGK